MSDKNSMKTYLITHDNGNETKISVPASWKVTFGPAARGNNAGKSHSVMPLALRFYEDETRQRAIFTDVKSFRDLSIPVFVKKKSTQEKHGFMECEGSKKATIFTVETSEWINPDEESDENRKLLTPSDVQNFDVIEEDFPHKKAKPVKTK